MTILVAMDSFKGSLSSFMANQAVREGIHLIDPSEHVHTVTVADGGEGTIEALRHPFQLRLDKYPVLNALGSLKEATYGFNLSTKIAVIEVAEVCGLPEIPVHLRDPMHATTFGVGQLILVAIAKGATHLYIGLGGSATTDGGFGMLRALGVRFFDESEEEILDTGLLHHIHRIDETDMHASLEGCSFTIICDVENPFFGKEGAAHIYGPQKGADGEAVQLLDVGLRCMAASILTSKQLDLQQIVGSGAAGGLGGAFAAFLDGKFVSGAGLILEANDVRKMDKPFTLMFSGEGKIDAQTLKGKLPMSIARMGSAQGVPVILLGGSVEIPANELIGTGIASAHSIAPGPMRLEEMIAPDIAFKALKEKAANCYLLWKSLQKG